MEKNICILCWAIKFSPIRKCYRLWTAINSLLISLRTSEVP